MESGVVVPTTKESSVQPRSEVEKANDGYR